MLSIIIYVYKVNTRNNKQRNLFPSLYYFNIFFQRLSLDEAHFIKIL